MKRGFFLPAAFIFPVVAVVAAAVIIPTAHGQETKAAGAAFLPEAVLPGDLVLPLYPPDSPQLKKERLAEPEKYNTTGKAAPGKLLNTLNIHNPSIEVHLVPQGAQNTGAAIIVAPGGGHQILWVGPEGYDTAPVFEKVGVSTIVLRNRLRVDGYDVKKDAVQDAFQAIRLVRAHAAEWRLDPAKIGIIGFSAGAELAAPAALFFDEFQKNSDASDPLAKVSARPDFVGLIYPGPTPFAKGATPAIPPKVPPSFVVCAGSGDKVHAIWATEYFTAMLQAGAPDLEMHIYGRGGHGGAISARDGMPFGTWHERFLEWFRDLGYLGAPGEETRAAKDVAAFGAKRGKG